MAREVAREPFYVDPVVVLKGGVSQGCLIALIIFPFLFQHKGVRGRVIGAMESGVGTDASNEIPGIRL